MVVQVAKVTLWDTIVGAVAWNDLKGCAEFEYDPRFLDKGWNIAPLLMPTTGAQGKIFSFPALNRETYRGLPGLLADSLPDRFGNAVLHAWLAREGRDPLSISPIERLCYTGKRGMGALEYEPALERQLTGSTAVEVEHLAELARAVLDERKRFESDLSGKGLHEILRVGTSAGGARAKAVIAFNPATGKVRSGQIEGLSGFEYWLIKFDGVSGPGLADPRGFGKIEYAYHLMAKQCGIEMMPCRLHHENGRAHFMTKRFDRIGSQKLHLQTLCAVAHFDYNDPTLYSYEQAFQTMRSLALPYTDAEQLYRRMVFNVVARNQDDHTKNFSFLMDTAGRWRLAPAYDITYAVDPANRWLAAHQLSVNGKRADINRQDLLTVAHNMNIKKPGDIIDEVVDAVASWSEFAKEATVSRSRSAAIAKTHLLGM
ncbi:MAG TPA: type II toxin-antitoxin system HipA family toxin [bacterium]|nr:type II toxin-antitoxin system HipA family toxin [bacterium]